MDTAPETPSAPRVSQTVIGSPTAAPVLSAAVALGSGRRARRAARPAGEGLTPMSGSTAAEVAGAATTRRLHAMASPPTRRFAAAAIRPVARLPRAGRSTYPARVTPTTAPNVLTE